MCCYSTAFGKIELESGGGGGGGGYRTGSNVMRQFQASVLCWLH